MLFNRITNALENSFVNAGRTRARRELLGYSDRFLADNGFSRELLESGNNAWPWRIKDTLPATGEQTIVAAKHGRSPIPARPQQSSSQAKAVAELKACSDAELAELGISRAGISDAVRYGRPGLDRDWDSDRKAA